MQGPAQSLNLKDQGFNVLVGQEHDGKPWNKKSWEKAEADGWREGENLFPSMMPVRRLRFYASSFPTPARSPFGQP